MDVSARTGGWRADAAAARRSDPRRWLPAVRAAVQSAYVCFFVLVGIEFRAFYVKIVSGGPVTASRPPAVEGFLPLSALVGLKQFLLTGRYDEVHPAGLTILIAAILSSFLARKVFCSWVCPVGSLSRALEWLGKKTLWRTRKEAPIVNRRVDAALSAAKYLLLGFFAWAILWKMDANALRRFLHSPYNDAADAKMLLFFTDLSRTAAVTLAVLAVLSVVIKNFWCRYLCPYGALLGIAGWMSPLTVVRDEGACTGCRSCTGACPVEIPVHRRKAVRTPECTGCMSCVAACPVADCLTVARKGKAGLSPYLVPAIGLGTIGALWAVATLTGHWHTALSRSTLARVYRVAASLAHP